MVAGVQLLCPRCRFLIAEFTADELARDSVKAKRYRALTTRQQFCGGCMCTVRHLDAVWNGAGGREGGPDGGTTQP